MVIQWPDATPVDIRIVQKTAGKVTKR